MSSEKIVWSLNGYAGTYDLLIMIDGELWLIDIKTGKGLTIQSSLCSWQGTGGLTTSFCLTIHWQYAHAQRGAGPASCICDLISIQTQGIGYGNTHFL